MIKVYYKTVKDYKVNLLSEFRIGSWIYVENPTNKDFKYLSEKFFLDLGLLKDAIDPYEVPRLEIDKNIVYIFTRIPRLQERVTTEPFLIIIGEDFVITVCQKSFPLLEKFINNRINFTTTQKTKFLLQIFSEITATYNNYLTTISRNVRSISVQLEKIDNKDIIQFVNFESVLNDFLAALVPTNAILNNLLQGKILDLYEEDKDLIEDLLLGNNQLIELCKANLKNIVNIREAYSTIMTNNLNRVIKFLTALTIILTVPMIISSFYGMNVNLPFASSPIAFWGISLTTLIVAIILLLIFFKKRWL